MKTYILSLAAVGLFAFGLASAAQYILISNPPATSTPAATGPVFTRAIASGDSGADVLALRAVLKADTGIDTGGSATFDSSAASALKKFQEKYAVDILVPQNLAAGTGVMDPYTIAKLNAVAAADGITLDQFAAEAAAQAAGIKTFFTQTLSLGSVGTQVILLKNILNADPATAIVYAAGQQAAAPDVFDAATEAAVVKFQEKYASEILTPYGLTAGTGVVGPSTRAKLNALENGLSGSASVSASSTAGLIATSSLHYVSTGNFSQNACTADVWTCTDWSACTPISTAASQQPASQPICDANTAAQIVKEAAGNPGAFPSLLKNAGCTLGNTAGSGQLTPSYRAPNGGTVTGQPVSVGVASTSGTQTRTCTLTFDCPLVNTPEPATVQSCSATPQTAQSDPCNPANLTAQQRAGLAPLPAGCSATRTSTSGGILGTIGSAVGGIVSGIGSVVGGVLGFFGI